MGTKADAINNNVPGSGIGDGALALKSRPLTTNIRANSNSPDPGQR